MWPSCIVFSSLSLSAITECSTCQGVRASMGASFLQFATALMEQVELESIQLSGSNLDSAAFYTLLAAEDSLKTLRFSFSTPRVPDFTKLNRLQTLQLRMEYSMNDLYPLLPLNASLQFLSLEGNSILKDISNLVNMTALQTASIVLSGGFMGFADTFKLPANLTSLSISNAPSTPVAIVATGTNFTKLSLSNFMTTMDITAVPSTVTKLTLMALNGQSPNGLNFVFPPALEKLTLSLGTMGQSAVIHASIASCSHLSDLSLSNSNLTHFTDCETPLQSTVDHLVCSIVDPSRLISLTLGRQIKKIPNCGVAAPYPALLAFGGFSGLEYSNSSEFQSDALGLLPSSLEILSFGSCGVGVVDELFDWDAFVTQFHSLSRLTFMGVAFAGTFPTQIIHLTSLEFLEFSNNNFAGTVPEGLFSNLTKLTRFSANANRITGTFPYYGLQNIENIYARDNMFTSWPSVAGSAPKLVNVDFSGNQLTQIPDDISFSGMTSLSSLTFKNNPTLGGPVPRFWANHPTLYYFSAANCGLSGTLPTSLTSRQLGFLDLSTNQICGPVFEVPQPRGLTEFHLENNLLTGTYPVSWAQNLTVRGTLGLQTNHMSGTIPSPFLSTLSTTLTKFQVSGNHFHGPVPDFSEYPSLSSVLLGDSSLDLCALSPNFTVSSLSCSLSNVAVDACNCVSRWSVCRSFGCSSTPPPADTVDNTPAELVCVIPPERPSATPAPPTTATPSASSPTAAAPTHTSAGSSNLHARSLQLITIALCLLAFVTTL